MYTGLLREVYFSSLKWEALNPIGGMEALKALGGTVTLGGLGGPPMQTSFNLNSLKGIEWGITVRVIKGGTRSLDNGSK